MARYGRHYLPGISDRSNTWDRWTLLILREAFPGTRRFDEFQRVPGVSPHTLAARLRRLVREELLSHDGNKGSEYRLRAAGWAMQPIILFIARWGNEWRSGKARHVEHLHAACQQGFEPTVVCSRRGEAVGLDVDSRLSDALRRDRSESGKTT